MRSARCWRPASKPRPSRASTASRDADLSTINGIGGTLDSTGRFSGPLTAITAAGHATVPDFSLDLGGKPVPLTAEFETLINGTNGATQLTRVDAVLRATKMAVTGAVEKPRGSRPS